MHRPQLRTHAGATVKKEYTNRETGDLLRQMRDGIVVPQLRQEECIDIISMLLKAT